jgi:hypothetical protein
VICDPVDVATCTNDQGNPVAAAEHPSVLRSSGRPARNGAATGAHAASRVREWCHSGRVDEVTLAAYESMLERDWDRLRLMLHPYLHWSAADGTRLRGRTKVIERLQRAAPPVKPAAVELRDGQIYRWQEPPEASAR